MAAVAPLYLHEFPEGLEWVNSAPITLSSLRGRVTLLHFWISARMTGPVIPFETTFPETQDMQTPNISNK